MITQCPACDTHFRVHADQLAARAGQVRCGKCNQVFNSLDHLIEEPVQAAAAAAPFKTDPESGTAATAALVEEAAMWPAPPADERKGGDEIDVVRETLAAETTPRGAWKADAIESRPAVAEAAWDFGPAAAAAKKARRWPWLLSALLMFIVLLAQAGYYYRTAVILLVPEAKPWFAQLCDFIGCELTLPRRIELMSIEASDLQADTTNPSVMVLSATLKNRAIFNQQLPLLELTLTDAQEQPVVRRVLSPQDYLGKTPVPPAGFAAGSELAVKVFVEGSQVKATGYRLYLFYP
jgi:predicted Zn finger-like uncharacterized protein